MKNQNLRHVSVLFSAAAVFLIFSLFLPLILAADFDFYATDLISKQAYRRISMDFRDASLKSILKVFSEQAGLNFIASQNVQDRTVTLYLDNVPLQEALNKIMAANNLKYELEPGSNIFIVKEWGKPEVETITKVYYLKYTRLKSSNLQKAIDAGPTTGASAAGGLSGMAGAAAGTTATGTTTTGGESGDAGIEGSVRAVLTSNGKVSQDVRTNSLIITDIPSQFPVIENVIALLDVATPQVMIEVEILDVDKKTVDEMGVSTPQSLATLTGGSRPVRFPSFMLNGASAPGAMGLTYGLLDATVFQATLDFLTTDSKTKFLARPRILTLSDESAEIKISTNEAIGILQTTSSSQSLGQSATQAERFETGVILKVTPQVDAINGNVNMYVQPMVAQSKTGATFGNQTFRDPEIRTSSTTLRVKDGETIVVGGLIRTDEQQTIRKAPFFGDIPILGAMFRHKEKTTEDRELIVFITPRIVGEKNVVSLAKDNPPLAAPVSPREQSSAVLRKEEVDSTLERWEN